MHDVEGRGDTTTTLDLPRVPWRRSAAGVEEDTGVKEAVPG
jgi:hypothetical protein